MYDSSQSGDSLVNDEARRRFALHDASEAHPNSAPGLAVSVVVPFKDEEQSLIELAGRITTVLRLEGKSFELVLVDDGSADASWNRALEACASYPEVRAIRHRRTFGKATALGTGFAAATGHTVITMDADLQDDPAEIPRILRLMDEGYDVVSGWKRVRHDPLGKRIPSRLFNAAARRASGIKLHDFNCGFKAYSASAARTLAPHLYGDMHRYLPVLLGAAGFRIGELEVRHHPRQYGKSKYGLARMLAGACDLLSVIVITRFRHRPLHAFGAAALMSLCAVGITGIAMATLAGPSVALLNVSIAGVMGATTLLAAGLVCELIVLGLGPAPIEGRLAEATRQGNAADAAAIDTHLRLMSGMSRMEGDAANA